MVSQVVWIKKRDNKYSKSYNIILKNQLSKGFGKQLF